eukprot:4722824-Pleurochrysis_carterae.AAC.1
MAAAVMAAAAMVAAAMEAAAMEVAATAVGVMAAVELTVGATAAVAKGLPPRESQWRWHQSKAVDQAEMKASQVSRQRTQQPRASPKAETQVRP